MPQISLPFSSYCNNLCSSFLFWSPVTILSALLASSVALWRPGSILFEVSSFLRHQSFSSIPMFISLQWPSLWFFFCISQNSSLWCVSVCFATDRIGKFLALHYRFRGLLIDIWSERWSESRNVSVLLHFFLPLLVEKCARQGHGFSPACRFRTPCRWLQWGSFVSVFVVTCVMKWILNKYFCSLVI